MSTIKSSKSPYPLYKESGVEWLGKIPKNWEVQAMKYGSDLNPSCRTSHLTPSTEVTFLPMEFVKSGFYIQNKSTYSKCAASYNFFEEGDIIIAKVTPCFENGNIAIANNLINQIGFGSSELFVIRCRSLDTKFMFYYLQNTDFKNQGEQSMTGAGGLKRVSSDCIQNHKMPTPSLPEQRSIAAFLDHETGKIDQLIDKQQNLISLLEEKRQAVISHAVTKGLNPDAPLKPSGVEWLGDVPEHWIASQIKHITSLIQTGPFGSQLHAEDYIEGGTPVINPAHLIADKIHPEYKVTITESVADGLDRHRLEPGEIIFGRRGELGRCALVADHNAGWICGTGSLRVTLKTEQAVAEYIIYYMGLQIVRDYLSLSSKGSTMENLNGPILGAVPLPLPSIKEQRAIVDYLIDQSSKLDSLTTKAKSAIELMQERRTALISAAVTGKIDVRDWKK